MHRLLAALVLMTTASLTWAHAHPLKSSPAANTTVKAPQQVSIDFSEPLEPAFSSLTVSDAKGTAISSQQAAFNDTRRTMSVSLPKLHPGRYRVVWKAVAVDGHRSAGAYDFTVH